MYKTSPYGHRATLLLYTSNNGIELWRQQVPMNLPRIIQLLLSKGADRKALMNVYNDQFTTHNLLATSAHIQNLGLLDQLNRIFDHT